MNNLAIPIILLFFSFFYPVVPLIKLNQTLGLNPALREMPQ
jgi:hypothetical protein